MKDCNNCIETNISCPFGDKTLSEKRRLIHQTFGGYEGSCWQSKEGKQMCDMMCGGTLDNSTSDDDLLAMYFAGIF